MPTAISVSPFLAAAILVTNSGRDVPIATMVRPMSVWLTPKEAAMALALSTTSCPPKITAASPINANKIPLGREGFFSPEADSKTGCLIALRIVDMIKNAKTAKRIKPSGLDRERAVPEPRAVSVKTRNRSAAMIERGYSLFKMCGCTGHGLSREQAPRTMSKLNKLEPITLPTAMPFWPVVAAVMLTAASGALVPKATMVRPMIKDGMLKYRAISELPSTKISAPLTSSMNPTINNM